MSSFAITSWNVSDKAASSLASAIGAAATSFDVDAGTGSEFPASNFVVWVGDELVFVGTRIGDTFSNCTRGFDGTTATLHIGAARVVLAFNHAYFEHLKNLILQHTHPLVEAGIVKAVKGADQAFSTTSFANDSDLSLSIGAGVTKSFVFEGTYVTALAATGLQLSISGPASPTDVKFGGIIAETATTSRYGAGVAYDAAGLAALASAAATPMPWRLWGTITTAATGGNIVLRVRSETNGSAVTLQRGSYGLLF